MTADLALTVGRVRLNAPVIPASGTFDLAHQRVFDINRLGALVPKTVTPGARTGNPAPRLTEEAGGLINAIGIPSDGLEPFMERVLPAYLHHAPPVIVSISADTAAEFAHMAQRLSTCAIGGLELNLSCPNLEHHGELFAAHPAAAAEVVALCRRATALPLWSKLTPAAAAPVDVAKACHDEGADAVIVGNTFPALALDASGAPRLANRTGGLSGAPVKPITLRLVDLISAHVPIDIVGCGGVSTIADALDYLAVGARAVAVGTATLVRPGTMVRLIDALTTHLAKNGPLDQLIRPAQGLTGCTRPIAGPVSRSTVHANTAR